MFSTSNIERCLFKIFTACNQTGPRGWFGGASPGENKQNWGASYTVYSSAQLQEAKFAAGVYT